MIETDDCEHAFTVADEQVSWPPRDPDERQFNPGQDERNEGFSLPSSPWTYENGSLNPSLQPSNSHLRSSTSSRRRNKGPVYALPPYHPDYNHQQQSEDTSLHSYYSSSSDEENGHDGMGRVRVRRGSEGYELRPVDREEMLRRYIEGRGDEVGRYNRYVPEPDSGESQDERE